MKVEKLEYKGNNNWFHYYYRDSQTGNIIWHGLNNDYSSLFGGGIGYYYHDEKKGFWLKRKNIYEKVK